MRRFSCFNKDGPKYFQILVLDTEYKERWKCLSEAVGVIRETQASNREKSNQIAVVVVILTEKQK